MPQFIPGKSLFDVSELKFAYNIGAEEGWIVRVDGDQKTGVEVAAKRVSSKAGANACAEVGCGIQLKAGVSYLQVIHQVRIVDSRQRMAEAFRADRECFPDGLRAGGFTSVIGEAQSSFASAGVHLTIGLGATAALVPTEADSNDGRVRCMQLRGFAENFLCFIEREMTDSIQDPVKGEAKFGFCTEAGAFETGEGWVEAIRIRIAPVIDDPDRDVDLGMNDPLFGEMLRHAPGREFVVFGRDEAFRNGFESEKESGEVGEVVERFCLMQRDRRGVVALAQFDECGRCDGAFEVKMELRFGQAADKGVDVGHSLILVGDLSKPRSPNRELEDPLTFLALW